MRRFSHWATLLVALLLSGCASPAYYWQLLKGQHALLAARQPLDAVIAAPASSAELRRRLGLLRDARRFAGEHLGLPAEGSYRSYVDLGRPYVAWNVFATPEFSLQGKSWCHLLVGCLEYRGYFDEPGAQKLAASLRAQGLDVYVGGVPAYSTLGWFDDPITSAWLRWDDDGMLGTLFHELGHQRLFVKGDTAFNESYASFVEDEGLREFRAARQEPPPSPQRREREEQFMTLVTGARSRLEKLYAGGGGPPTLRAGKAQIFADLRADYAALRARWGGYSGYDSWFAADLNNAKLLPLGLYHQWIPAFAEVFRRVHGDWPAFYAEVKKLGDRPAREREAALRALAAPN